MNVREVKIVKEVKRIVIACGDVFICLIGWLPFSLHLFVKMSLLKLLKDLYSFVTEAIAIAETQSYCFLHFTRLARWKRVCKCPAKGQFWAEWKQDKMLILDRGVRSGFGALLQCSGLWRSSQQRQLWDESCLWKAKSIRPIQRGPSATPLIWVWWWGANMVKLAQ